MIRIGETSRRLRSAAKTTEAVVSEFVSPFVEEAVCGSFCRIRPVTGIDGGAIPSPNHSFDTMLTWAPRIGAIESASPVSANCFELDVALAPPISVSVLWC